MAATTWPGAAAPLGVGMDLAERSAFGHLDDASIGRAADRWLRPDERAWCAAQPSFREAMVTVLSCKEAMYKAWAASGEAYEVSLRMLLHGARRRAVALGTGPEVVASWEVLTGSILTVAVAAPAGRAWPLLEMVVSASRSLRAANAPGGGGHAAAAVPGRSDSPGDS